MKENAILTMTIFQRPAFGIFKVKSVPQSLAVKDLTIKIAINHHYAISQIVIRKRLAKTVYLQ